MTTACHPRRRRPCTSSALLLCLLLVFGLAVSGVSGRKKDPGQCDCTAQCEAMETALKSKITDSSAELDAAKTALAELEAQLESVKTESATAGSAGSNDDELLSQKDAAIAALQTELDSLKTELESTKATVHAQSSEVVKAEEKCRLDLADSMSKQNDAIQSERSLRDQLARTESEADKREAEVRKRIAELGKEAETSRTQVKHINERYAETRREVIEAQAEVRDLHRKLTSRYVNTTLMYEDGVWLVDRSAVMAKDNANWLLVILADFWTNVKQAGAAALDVVKPVVEDLTDDFRERYDRAAESARPHIRKVTNQTMALVGPHIDTVKTTTKKMYNDNAKPFVDDKVLPNVLPLWERAGEIMEGIRLSAVSSIQQSSNSITDLINKNKDKNDGPLREGALDQLKWTHDNADYCVTILSCFVGAILVYILFGSFVGRCVMFVVKTVTFPIWFVFWVLSKVFGSGKKQDAIANDQEKTNGNGEKMNGH